MSPSDMRLMLIFRSFIKSIICSDSQSHKMILFSSSFFFFFFYSVVHDHCAHSLSHLISISDAIKLDVCFLASLFLE